MKKNSELEKNNLIIKVFVFVVLVLVGILSRYLPHPWNFTPLTAIALFTGAYFGIRYSFLAVIFIMLGSDMLIGFYEWQMMFAVYGSMLLSGIIGSVMENKKVLGILSGTLASSLVFFFVTNWAVWQFGTMYSHSFRGLIESYFMALPFFKNSLAGDVLFTGLFFGGRYAINYSFEKIKSLNRVYL